jgi:hypothetical protein
MVNFRTQFVSGYQWSGNEMVGTGQIGPALEWFEQNGGQTKRDQKISLCWTVS